jgi:CDP-glucose 4,6-dehydratase
MQIEELIATWRPDYIFHLAAISQVVDAEHAPLQTYEINVMGTANILEAVRKSGLLTRVVVASSDKAYGKLPLSVRAHEGTMLDPYHPYDVSKAAADYIARSYASIYKMPIAITRCGNIYGPGDSNWQRIIPGAIRAALEDEVLDIRSNGKLVRVYNYIDDILEAYLIVAQDLLLYPDRWGISWAIAAPEDYYSVLEVVEKVSEVMGKDVAVNILGGAANEEFALRLDPKKITGEYRWFPQTTLEEGIAETVEWMREFLDDTRL